MPYILLVLAVLAGVAFALMGLAYKRSAARGCDPFAFAVAFLATATAVAGIRAVIWEATPWADGRLWLLGAAMIVPFYLSLTLVVTVNRMGPPSVVWTLVNLSLIVPLLLSHLCLGEPLHPIDFLILIAFGLLLYVLRRGTSQSPGGDSTAAPPIARGFWPLMTLQFLANGVFIFGSKLKFASFGDDASAGFTAVCCGTTLILALAVHAFRARTLRLRAREWSCGAPAGLCFVTGMLLQIAAMRLPAAVVFPISQGVSLVGGMLLTTLVYREVMNRWKIAGLVLGTGVIALSALREASEPIDAQLPDGVSPEIHFEAEPVPGALSPGGDAGK